MSPAPSRRRFLKTIGGAVIGTPALGGLYGWRVEPTWLEITRRRMPIPGLPPALEGRTLAHLSDLHIGPQVDTDYLVDVFRRTTALAPDFVVITGDLLTYKGPDPVAHLRSVFQHLPQGKRGTFVTLGNHDYGRNWGEPSVANAVAAAARSAGAEVLRNRAVTIDGLQFAGFDDLWAGRFSLDWTNNLSVARPTIALSHNPDTVDLPGWDRFNGWVLSGHTHGGQCKPPFLAPPLLPVKNRRYTSGEFALRGGRRLFISRGVGHTVRIRINCRPEVTLFRLVRENAGGIPA